MRDAPIKERSVPHQIAHWHAALKVGSLKPEYGGISNDTRARKLRQQAMAEIERLEGRKA